MMMKTAIALALCFALPALALEPPADGSVCPALTGDERQHELNKRRRDESLVLVEASPEEAGEIVVVHNDPKMSAPGALRMDGVEVAKVEALEEGRYALVLELGDALKSACGVERLQLSVDDSLGRNHQVAWVGESGALLLADDELAWIGVERELPSFQMVWRSTFSVDVVSNAKSPAKRPAKRKPRPKKRKKR